MQTCKMYNLTNLSFNEHRVIYVMNKLPKNLPYGFIDSKLSPACRLTKKKNISILMLYRQCEVYEWYIDS